MQNFVRKHFIAIDIPISRVLYVTLCELESWRFNNWDLVIVSVAYCCCLDWLAYQRHWGFLIEDYCKHVLSDMSTFERANSESFVHNLSDSCPEMKEPVRTPQKKREEVSGFFHLLSHTRSHCKHTNTPNTDQSRWSTQKQFSAIIRTDHLSKYTKKNN